MGTAVPYTAHEVASPFQNLLYKEGCKTIFVSPDPIGMDGGINLYVYVENNPIRFEDPTGLWHGNWCGPGGAGPPIDCVDESCMKHDKCYEECGLNARNRWYPKNIFNRCADKCDNKLLKDLRGCQNCKNST